MMIETYFPRPAWFVNGATARRCRYDTVCDSASRSACCLGHSRLARGAYRRGLAGPQPVDSGSARPQVRVRRQVAGELAEQTPVGKFRIKQGETDMGDKGRRDKGKKEQQKKSQLTQKEKRKKKKDKKNK